MLKAKKTKKQVTVSRCGYYSCQSCGAVFVAEPFRDPNTGDLFGWCPECKKATYHSYIDPLEAFVQIGENNERKKRTLFQMQNLW